MSFDADRFSDGDRVYVRQLMDEHAGVVRAACASYASGPDHAEDLWQETWLRVLLKAHTFRGDGSFDRWLSRIATNVCLSDLRSGHSRALPNERALKDLRDPRPGPAQRLQRKEDRELVVAALGSLTAREREAVQLRVLEGNSTAEVAALLGVSRATVRSHLRHAMRHLREILAGESTEGINRVA